MMTDIELQTRVAEFVGWTELHTEDVSDPHSETRCIMLCGRQPGGGIHGRDVVPNYVGNLNAWHADVVPKLNHEMMRQVAMVVQIECGSSVAAFYSSAKDRCEALVKVLDERGAQS